MKRHFLEICGEEIDVRWCKRPDRAYALRECSEVTVAPIKSVISYATAMHELGHIFGRHQGSKRVFVREDWAWRWARANALCWTERMERHAQDSLSWYRDRPREIDADWQPAMLEQGPL